MSVLIGFFPHWLGKMKTLPSLKSSLNRSARACPAPLIATALLFAAAIPVQANTCTVTSTADSGAGTLRACLASAADGDTIDATGVSGTILLTSGELAITHNVTINGPGAANLAINGNAAFRVFHNFASNATISRLTITNGLGVGPGGGGIYNQGGLTLSNCTVSNNVAGSGCCFSGGGIQNDPGTTLSVSNCTFTGNSASFDGGGIQNHGATATVTNSSFTSNSVGREGGAIQSDVTGNVLTVSNSAITNNSAADGGGGIASDGGGGTITISNTTINGNSLTG